MSDFRSIAAYKCACGKTEFEILIEKHKRLNDYVSFRCCECGRDHSWEEVTNTPDVDHFLIELPNDQVLHFHLSKLEQSQFAGDEFPLFEVIENHIRKNGYSAKGAQVFEAIQHRGVRSLIHLKTF